jgi:hypothetical protein
VIFGCSPTSKCSWKGVDLTHETTLYGTRRPSCTPFAKRHSRNASNNGRTGGRSVFSHKETTSKGIRVADLQVCKCIFPSQRLDTFWTGLVKLHVWTNQLKYLLTVNSYVWHPPLQHKV